jgi:hypothetical protein
MIVYLKNAPFRDIEISGKCVSKTTLFETKGIKYLSYVQYFAKTNH